MATLALARPIGARRALVLAVALPPLFLHAELQPGFSIGLGSTGVEIRLSDLAVLAVLAAAAVDVRRRGARQLAGARWLWIASGALLVWIVAGSLYGAVILDGFPVLENLVTAAKFVEYALLAPAVAVLVRTREELRPVLIAIVAWCAIATAVGLLQLAGLDLFDVSDPGRQRSFLGHHDFAALSGAVFALGLAALVLEDRRRRLVLAAGGLGLILAAPLAGVLGLAFALGGLLLLARMLRPFPVRRALVAVALSVAVSIGMLAMRAETVTDFLRFLSDDEPTREIESYSQRTLLVYIGLRIFLDDPLLGVGFHGSFEPEAFEPYLADAHERFPTAAPGAFPSSEHPYGVQNLYVQTLADLGVVGFGLLLAVFTAALVLARRGRRNAAGVVGLLWLVFAAGLWTSQGLLAGLPLDALTWIALGLIASGAEEGRSASR